MSTVMQDVAARAVARSDEMTKMQNAIRRVVELGAGQSPGEQARAISHILAAWDPCTAGPDTYGQSVLKRIKADIDRRIESGEW